MSKEKKNTSVPTADKNLQNGLGNAQHVDNGTHSRRLRSTIQTEVMP